MLDELWALWENKNFIYTFLIFTIMNGSAVCLSAIITFLIEPFGFNSVESSIMGASSVICGFISSFLFPILIQKYKWYLKSVKLLTIGAFFAMICISLSLESRKLVYTLTAICLFGFFNIPVMSVIYTFTTEITYPVSEALTASILSAGSNLFSCLTTYLSLYIIHAYSATCAHLLFIFFYGIAMLLSFKLEEDLRRLRVDEGRQ